VITYDYATGLDNTLSRVSAIGENSGTNHLTIEGYQYLGLGTIVEQDRPENSTELTLIRQAGDTLAGNDGGDQYVGLDRFGRIADQNWIKNNGTSAATTLDRFQYGYDADSNVMYKDNKVNSSFSELYHASGTSGAYDALNRLTGFVRGTLSATARCSTRCPAPTPTPPPPSSGAWIPWQLRDDHHRRHRPEPPPNDQQNELNTLTTGTNTNNACLRQQRQSHHRRVRPPSLLRRLEPSGRRTVGRNADIADFIYDGDSRMATGIRYSIVTGYVQLDRYYTANWQMIEEDNNGKEEEDVVGPRLHRQPESNATAIATPTASRSRPIASGAAGCESQRHDNRQQLRRVQERFVYDPYGQFTTLKNDWTAQPGTSATALDWRVTFQGYRYDPVITAFDARSRIYDAVLQRFWQQEPFCGGTSMGRICIGRLVAIRVGTSIRRA